MSKNKVNDPVFYNLANGIAKILKENNNGKKLNKKQFTIQQKEQVERMMELEEITRTKGDVNTDGEIDILDVIKTITIILGVDPAPTDDELWASDCNGDEYVDILDVVGIVNVILGLGSCSP